MQESKTYQRQVEKITRQNTIECILDLLEDRFQAEAVHALTPMLNSINDLQRLKQLHLAAAKVQSIEDFKHLLNG